MTTTPPGPGSAGPDAGGNGGPQGADDRYDPYRYGRPDPDRQPSWPARPPPRPNHPYPSGPSGYAPPPMPEQGRGNGMATAGLVFGILSVVLCFLNFLDLVLIVPGLVFSILGLNAAKRGRSGRGLAVAGIVLSVLGAVAAVAVLMFAYTTLKDCVENYSPGSSGYQTCVRSKL